jgi:hypothetical protein
MKTGLLLAASALLLNCAPVWAAAGDVYVPAHRSRDGTFVPANVPTSSGGTRLTARLGRSGESRSAAKKARNGSLAPIFVEARAVRPS